MQSQVNVQGNIKHVEFEIFGKVQRVHFRRFTKIQAKDLNVCGWVKNTTKGTVVGAMEGRTEAVDMMMEWLRNTGSPKSTIVKAEFKNEKSLPELTMKDFVIRLWRISLYHSFYAILSFIILCILIIRLINIVITSF